MIDQHYYCGFLCTWIGWFLLASFCCCCYPVDAFGVARTQHLTASRVVVEGGSSNRFGVRKCQLDRGTNQISPRWNGGHQEIKEEEGEDDATYLTDSHRRRLLHQALRVGISITALVLSSRDSSCLALSPDEASSAYNSYAAQYDQLDGGDASTILGITQARSQLMRRAKGNVLEIGVGTGLNLEYYDPERITSLTLVDISDGMLEQAKQRIETLQQQQQQQQQSWKGVSVTFVRADATRDLEKVLLQVGDDRSSMFDTVVDTFSLCVMGNDGARQCLNQLRNVVKDVDHGGMLYPKQIHPITCKNAHTFVACAAHRSNPTVGKLQIITTATSLVSRLDG